MTSIRKQVMVGGSAHYVEVNSSLDLEEVEITGLDPMSGKTVHISLSSLLRTPRPPGPDPLSPAPVEVQAQGLMAMSEDRQESENIENALNSIFRQ